MTGTPQYVDISAYQAEHIDWHAYRAWAAQWDGIARVSLRTTYGTGFTDEHFASYRAGALAAGIDVIIYYHYAYPQFNAAVAEADWQHSIVGAIRRQDILMLDYEENVPQATSAWAHAWLLRQQSNYGKMPIIYSFFSFIQERLQDVRLAAFPLVLADYTTYQPTTRPQCPAPWKSYTYLQYTDHATGIPGILGKMDCNVYLGTRPSVQKIPGMINITDPFVANHFMQTSTNPERWHCVKTGQDLSGGILAGWCAMNGAPRLPTGPEVLCGTHAVCQECEAGIVVYDPDRELDAPDGPWTPCYLLKLDSSLAKSLLVAAT